VLKALTEFIDQHTKKRTELTLHALLQIKNRDTSPAMKVIDRRSAIVWFVLNLVQSQNVPKRMSGVYESQSSTR
jgi:hypothetical protein